MFPKDVPPKSPVCDYFSAWRRSGLWARLNAGLRIKGRVAAGRKPAPPPAAILDSQSVQGAAPGGPTVGDAAGQQIGGRKRHLLMETLGLILGLGGTAAAVQDRAGAAPRLSSLYLRLGRLQIIRADGGDARALVEWVKGLPPCGKLHLDIVRRRAAAQGFPLVRTRWIVARTFSWLDKSRRLSRDYQKRLEHSKSHIYLCLGRLRLKRLAKT